MTYNQKTGFSIGNFGLDFHREAPSLEEAIQTAIANVRKVGFATARVEIDPAVVGMAG